ncbi:lytic transglycosylase domain-containing protein [Enterobacter hormaechei]|nr:lytic transglycosylase domain-containing protein [Enterobacter hormaechei]EKS6646229.1 lytic transglycosylase domain-containing protein [Enterobacter hormaechei]
MTFTRLLLSGLILAGSLLSLPARAFCFQEAGARYHIDPLLLRAMTKVESGFNPQAVNYNRDHHGKVTSTDYGLMQINSSHIPELRALGIIRSRQDLLTNTCLNVQIGAWILAKSLKRCGVTWQCLGSYNAGFAEGNSARRMVYARRVYDSYRRLRGA